MSDFFADLEGQLRSAHARRPSRARRAAAPVAAVALALAAALALVVALGGGGSTSREAASPQAAPSPVLRVPTTPVPVPAHPAGVALLNGTTQPGLAARIASRLGDQGFRIVAVTNAARKNATTTRVGFRGSDASTALALAARLRVHLVGPLRAADAALAGREAGVVVVLGEDAAGGIVSAPTRPVTPAASVLRPAGGTAASATVTVTGGLLKFSGRGLARHSYVLWLLGQGGARHALGHTPVPFNGRLRFTAPLPADARRYTTILLTRGTGARPGPVVLVGALP
jgi:hypothetical protein